jgi:hypothetical protein
MKSRVFMVRDGDFPQENNTRLEAYKKLLAIPGSPAALGLGKTSSLYQRILGSESEILVAGSK